MMELVAMHLRKEGVYMCRTLSFAGCDFHVAEDSVEPRMLATYDLAAQLWQEVFTDLNKKC